MDKGAPPPYSPYPNLAGSGGSMPPPPQGPHAQAYPKQHDMAHQPPPPQLLQQPLPNFGPEAQRCTCPHCHAIITTQIKTEPTTRTHLAALLLLCLCWPCTCVPYCVDSCQNMNHYCPNCNAYLGTYQN